MKSVHRSADLLAYCTQKSYDDPSLDTFSMAFEYRTEGIAGLGQVECIVEVW